MGGGTWKVVGLVVKADENRRVALAEGGGGLMQGALLTQAGKGGGGHPSAFSCTPAAPLTVTPG